ncbi:MAG: hypothetical protein M1113_00105 [Candidatus Thermoplasmatota archaeon]|nr:hypothetical protein [Candidatus Thermoplasmatota archaeon]
MGNANIFGESLTLTNLKKTSKTILEWKLYFKLTYELKQQKRAELTDYIVYSINPAIISGLEY